MAALAVVLVVLAVGVLMVRKAPRGKPPAADTPAVTQPATAPKPSPAQPETQSRPARIETAPESPSLAAPKVIHKPPVEPKKPAATEPVSIAQPETAQPAVASGAAPGEPEPSAKRGKAVEYLLRARAASRAGKLDEAEEFISKAEAIDPEFDKVKQARQKFDTFKAKRKEGRALRLVQQAQRAMGEGRLAEAEWLVARAGQIAPGLPQVERAKQRLRTLRHGN